MLNIDRQRLTQEVPYLRAANKLVGVYVRPVAATLLQKSARILK